MLTQQGSVRRRSRNNEGDAHPELEYHLLLAHDLGLLNTLQYEPLTKETTEVKRMLAPFIKKLRSGR